MSQPTPGDRHVDTALTNISVAFMQEDPLVATRAFPVVPVRKQSDVFFSYDKEFWNRIIAQKRAAGTESAGGGYELTEIPYRATKYSVHLDTPEESMENEDDALDAQLDATDWVTQQIKLRAEKTWSDNAFGASIWTGSSTGGDITPGTLWSASGSTPVKDIREQRNAIKRQTGQRGNVLILGSDVMAALQDNADIQDRIKYTQRAVVTEDILASLFEVDEVIVAELSETTTEEGLAAQTQAFILGINDALLLHRPRRPGLRTPSAGYTFEWTGKNGSLAGQRIKRWWIDRLSSERVEADHFVDFKVVAPDLGAFFLNVVS